MRAGKFQKLFFKGEKKKYFNLRGNNFNDCIHLLRFYCPFKLANFTSVATGLACESLLIY